MGRRHRNDQRHRIGIPYVLRRRDHDSSRDEPRIFSRFEHPGQPIGGGVRIAAAHALDERAGSVVVLVACGVVLDGLFLD